jgi:hypothetical protein
MFVLLEIPTTQVEDLLITYVHLPVKSEPVTYDDINLPQLDGQTDFASGDKQKKRNKNLINKTIDINNISQRPDTSSTNTNNKKKSSNQSIDENNRPLVNQSNSASTSSWEHMIMAEQKLNSFREIKRNNSTDGFIQRQNIPVTISKYFKVNYLYHIIRM